MLQTYQETLEILIFKLFCIVTTFFGGDNTHLIIIFVPLTEDGEH